MFSKSQVESKIGIKKKNRKSSYFKWFFLLWKPQFLFPRLQSTSGNVLLCCYVGLHEEVIVHLWDCACYNWIFSTFRFTLFEQNPKLTPAGNFHSHLFKITTNKWRDQHYSHFHIGDYLSKRGDNQSMVGVYCFFDLVWIFFYHWSWFSCFLSNTQEIKKAAWKNKLKSTKRPWKR